MQTSLAFLLLHRCSHSIRHVGMSVMWPAAAAAVSACRALIMVERESQAPIVLGAGGRAIKKLAIAARQQIEEFLGRPVYLELTVQVGNAPLCAGGLHGVHVGLRACVHCCYCLLL
jgi:hypothetical protein